MSITIKVSDLLKMAQHLTKDGYEYVQLSEVEPDPDYEIPAGISFDAYGEFGGMVDFEEIDHIELPEDYSL